MNLCSNSYSVGGHMIRLSEQSKRNLYSGYTYMKLYTSGYVLYELQAIPRLQIWPGEKALHTLNARGYDMRDLWSESIAFACGVVGRLIYLLINCLSCKFPWTRNDTKVLEQSVTMYFDTRQPRELSTSWSVAHSLWVAHSLEASVFFWTKTYIAMSLCTSYLVKAVISDRSTGKP